MDFKASMEGEHNERVMNLLVKSGCRDFHSQDEPRRSARVRRGSLAVRRGRLDQESENGECIYACK